MGLRPPHVEENSFTYHMQNRTLSERDAEDALADPAMLGCAITQLRMYDLALAERAGENRAVWAHVRHQGQGKAHLYRELEKRGAQMVEMEQRIEHLEAKNREAEAAREEAEKKRGEAEAELATTRKALYVIRAVKEEAREMARLVTPVEHKAGAEKGELMMTIWLAVVICVSLAAGAGLSRTWDAFSGL
jgi:hypothetical protein